MVAVVRYAYDKRANPQVGVAFPLIKDAYEVEPASLLFILIFSLQLLCSKQCFSTVHVHGRY